MRFPCVSLEIRKRWKWRRNSEFPVETEIVHFTPSDPSASDRHSYLTMEGCDWLLEEKTFHTKEEALRFRSVLDGYRTFRLSSMSVMPTCSSTSWGRSGGSESSGCSVSDFHHLFILNQSLHDIFTGLQTSAAGHLQQEGLGGGLVICVLSLSVGKI